MKFRLFAASLLLLLCAIGRGQEASMKTIVQTGHYGTILCLDISPDGKLLLTGSQDQTIRLWEMSTGRELRTFHGHEKGVRTIQFHPDGHRFVSVAYDKKAILWDVTSGQMIREWKDSADVIRSAVFSPDGKRLLTGGHRNNAMMWDLESGERLKTFKTKPETCYQCVPDLVWAPEGNRFYTGAADRTTLIWDVSKGDTLSSHKFNKGSCSSCNTYLDIDASGEVLVKADYRGGMFLIDAQNGKKKKELLEDGEFYGIQFHPQGQYIMGLVEYNGQVRVWETRNGKEVMKIEAHDGIKAMGFTPDGKYIVTAGEDHRAALRQFPSGRLVRTFKGIVTRISEEGLNSSELYYLNLLKDTEMSPDGQWVAQCQRDSAALIWDRKSGRIVRKLYAHRGVVTSVAFSPDSKTLATGGTDRKIRLWNVSSGELLRTIDAHYALVLHVRFSKDGEQLISGSWDGWFRVWNVADGSIASEAKKHEGSPYTVSISPNGLYGVSGGLDRKLKVTELDSREDFVELIGHSAVVQSMAWHPDEHRLLTGGWDGTARLWDVRTGWQERRFSGHKGPVYAVAYDTSGTKVVTGSEDKTARLWDAASGKLIRTFAGHEGGVNYVAITPDGRHLLTASRDKSVKIWDLHSGKLLATHITLSADHWMAKNPGGFFEGSPEATRKLFFVKGNRSYSLEQFFEQFYQPGVMKNALSMNNRSASPEQVLGLLESSPPPSVSVLAPLNGDTLKGDRAELILKVANTGGDINEVRLLHNNKRIDLPDRLQRTPKKGQDMILNYSVQLVPGVNELAISAFSDGRVESIPEKLTVHYKGTPKTADLYVLSIGINDYENPAMALNYASADAKSFARAIEKKSKKLFDKIEVITLLDQDATKARIMEELDGLIAKVGKEDVLYFYYAGHGGMGNREFYFIPVECVSLYQEDKLSDAAISATLLNEKLRQISALKQVVVLDACHSGASTQVLASRGLMEEKALAQLARSTGIHIMAAAGSEQQAVEFGQLGHGVFTYVLLEALEGKADGAPMDEKVTIYELKSYLDDQVPEQSKAYQGSTQYPNTFSLGQDFPMVIIAP